MTNSVLVFDGHATETVQATDGVDVYVFDVPVTVIRQEATTDFLVITSGVRGPSGLPGLGLPTFVHGGVLEPILTSNTRIYNDFERTMWLGILRATVEGPCTGDPIIVDLTMDGTSLGVPITLGPGVDTATVRADQPWPPNSYIGVLVPQVGSVYPGDNLMVSAVAQ